MLDPGETLSDQSQTEIFSGGVSAPAAAPRKAWPWRRIGLYAAGAFLLLLAVVAAKAPLSRSLQPITAPSLTLLSAEGIPIARRGAVVGYPVSVKRLPEHVIQPFIAIEDRRFFSHLGVDPRGIARAMLNNLRAGTIVEGGSTITQQLAKLSFLSSEQTLGRKLQEFVLAFWLEARLSKEEILSRYLSSVYLGNNIYGLRAAANYYFHKKPEDLSLGEAAMLAGMVKAPSRLAPTSNPRGAEERAAVVISAMVASGSMTQGEARKLPRIRLRRGPVKNLPSGTYFADWVYPQAEAELEGAGSKHRIRTTLEDRLQRAAAAAIRTAGVGQAQVALVAMRPDGRVVAMVGGKNYHRSPFNRATQARRQPGSTFKLFVYLAALRANYGPNDTISDMPIKVGKWSPENYEGRYRGTLSLREAFAHSSNVAAVRLAQAAGRDRIVRAARDLGLKGELEDGPTLALGTSGVSLIELVSAYAAVASGRYPVSPHGLPRENRGSPAAAMDQRVRAGMLDLLHAVVVNGSGRAAALPVPAFGKTGTSQDSRDAYFIGFTKDLVAGVWIGFDDNRPMHGVQGGGLPARIWRAFMVQAAPGQVQPAPVKPRARQDPAAPAPSAAPAIATEGYDVGESWGADDPGGLLLVPEALDPSSALPADDAPEPAEVPAEPSPADVAPVIIPQPAARPPPAPETPEQEPDVQPPPTTTDEAPLQ